MSLVINILPVGQSLEVGPQTIMTPMRKLIVENEDIISDSVCRNLLRRLLAFDPNKRINARDASNHIFCGGTT
jgi:serine/threonine protein kinase